MAAVGLIEPTSLAREKWEPNGFHLRPSYLSYPPVLRTLTEAGRGATVAEATDLPLDSTGSERDTLFFLAPLVVASQPKCLNSPFCSAQTPKFELSQVEYSWPHYSYSQ